MQNLLQELKSALQSDERLIVDGSLVKNKIVELALAMDEGLLALLLSNNAIKKQFFREVGGVLVFDKAAFQSFVSNKQFLPDSYTALKNKIGLTANREYLTESKEVVLAWPYKDCVLAGGQTKEDQKRKEIFWNETLAADEIDRLLEPKALTNFKKYDKDGEREVESVSLDDNLIIKGNNLLALHSLKKQYTGKVKLIYIDPPYNTGNDGFGYNDRFNHSAWLTFMRNRLEVVRGLLRDDGGIFVSCDDNEQAYLKVLMDEVFGRENFIINFAVIRSEGGGLAKQVVKGHDHLILFAKKINSFIPLKKPKDIRGKIIIKNGENYWIESDWLRKEFGKYGTCHYEEIEKIKGREKKIEIDQGIKDGIYVLVPKKKGLNAVGRLRLVKEDGTKFYSVLKHLNARGNDDLNGLGFDFSFPKPVSLLKEIIRGATFFSKDKNDIILDFFAGSGTTAHAVLGLNKEDGGNRRYILCEQMDYVQEVTVERVKAVLKQGNTDSSFIYCELAQHNANVIDKIEQAGAAEALKAIWREMENTDFISYKIKPETINQNIHEFEALSLAEQKRFLIAVLDKNQLYVNYSEIDDADYQIPEADKKLNKQFYGE